MLTAELNKVPGKISFTHSPTARVSFCAHTYLLLHADILSLSAKLVLRLTKRQKQSEREVHTEFSFIVMSSSAAASRLSTHRAATESLFFPFFFFLSLPLRKGEL